MFDFVGTFILFILGTPVIMFLLECTLGLLRTKEKSEIPADYTDSQRAVILVPAHNESSVIKATLENISSRLHARDEILVVADNCDDDTAAIARLLGVGVVERDNISKAGKGYALDYGVKTIAAEFSEAPDLIIVVDADCFLELDALSQLKYHAMKTNRPVQACYLMQAGEIDRLSIKIAEFTFMIKNKIRMRGLQRMGIPVPLTGSGMAFPWKIIKNMPLASGDIVEDMRLGIELVEQGLGPGYIDEAKVFSFFPANPAAEETQRERWEHGHLNTLKKFAPRLFSIALKNRDFPTLGVLLNLLIPPLSLLIILLIVSGLFFSFIALFSGDWLVSKILGMFLLMIVLITAASWLKFGRAILTTKELLSVPYFVLKKLLCI